MEVTRRKTNFICKICNMRCTVPAGIWGQWKLSTPASRLPLLCKHNKVSLCHTGDLSQLLGWQHLLISWMSEWSWSLLNFLQAAALALLHDEETVGLPAGLGLHREALHHVPRHAQVLHLDTGKLARLLCIVQCSHGIDPQIYSSVAVTPDHNITICPHCTGTATHLNSFHGYSPGITGSTECFHHSFSNFFPEQIQNI